VKGDSMVMKVTRYILEIKKANFYLMVPPFYERYMEKWSGDIEKAYRFDTRVEAEDALDMLPNNKDIKVKPIRDEAGKEKPVVPTGNKDKNLKDYAVTLKYDNYEVTMTFIDETEEDAIDKAIGESIDKSRTINKPLIMATLKPK